MSVAYVPVQWNRNKWYYDTVLILLVVLYLVTFLWLAPEVSEAARATNDAIQRMRATGSCAFLMLTVILCIGPLARLDRRFLPILYNRRHFGVLTACIAAAHLGFVLQWYYSFSPTDPWAALLGVNPAWDRAPGFAFEILGLFALLCLAILAATSHDFWLSFLSAPVWKRLHLLIYPAYAAVVGHVAFGAVQDQSNAAFAIVVAVSAFAVTSLHLAAHLRRHREPAANAQEGWERVCDASEIEEGLGRVHLLATGERVAVFRHKGAFSAISNACAHQNGPLGEGRIVWGCVTCPWHGFQYDVRTGRSPEPFTEKVPTYNLRLEGTEIWVEAAPNPPGTPTEAVPAP